MKKEEKTTNPDICPKCGSPLGPVTETTTGKKLRRCSTGSWNKETKQVEGCDYVKWMDAEPEKLDEKCPKCGANLVMMTTRNGKKMKKCSTSGWDREARKATGCDYIEWFNGSKEMLKEECPQCGQPLMFVVTANGKKMKKCSTSGWDRVKREPTGCTFVEWINDNKASNGDEDFPAFEQ